MMRSRATRDELFEKDEYSVSWADHQVWRLQRLMDIESERTGIPLSSLRLAFESRVANELITRDGHKVVYKPEGVVNHMNMPVNPAQTMTFEISWVDPWGFYHQDLSNFFELRFKAVDEVSFRRLQRLAFKASEALCNP